MGAAEKIRVPVNLKLIAKGVLSELDILIAEEKARVEVITEFPVIYADPIHMSKLFLNLISNAIKFHKPNVLPVVKIYHRFIPPIANECEKIEITFEDNGIGFDETFNEDIFRLFRKNVESEGQGIGLAVSRKICLLHGGNLTAKSCMAAGTKFFAILATQPEK
jgi:signal transduction histidine kinase